MRHCRDYQCTIDTHSHSHHFLSDNNWLCQTPSDRSHSVDCAITSIGYVAFSAYFDADTQVGLSCYSSAVPNYEISREIAPDEYVQISIDYEQHNIFATAYDFSAMLMLQVVLFQMALNNVYWLILL